MKRRQQAPNRLACRAATLRSVHRRVAASEIYLRGDLSYRSEQPTSAIALQETDEQLLVNTRVGWVRDNYEISLFAKNLFDARYIVSAITEPEFFPSTTFTTGFVGNGRVIGLTAEMKF
jgi:outer membrane receptor protein involved in Fe transport